MNLIVPFSLVLLVILASLHFIAKVKSENLSAFFKWSGYLVLLAAVGLFLCLVFKGTRKMNHRMRGADKEYMRMEKHMGTMRRSSHGMDGCSGKSSMDCGHGMKSRSSMKQMDCCNEKEMSGMECCSCCDMEMMEHGQMGSGCDRMKSESTTDTIDGKIIKKEVKIIKQ